MDLTLGMTKGMCDRTFYCAQSMQWVCKALKPSEATSSSTSILSQYVLQASAESALLILCSLLLPYQTRSGPFTPETNHNFFKNPISFKIVLVLSEKLEESKCLLLNILWLCRVWNVFSLGVGNQGMSWASATPFNGVNFRVSWQFYIMLRN